MSEFMFQESIFELGIMFSQKVKEESKDKEVCRTWWLHFRHGEKS
jgi:hypothetical protein